MSTATHAQLIAEIASNLPSGNPTVLTAASLRQVVTDQVDSLNVAASTTSTVNLSTYQPFANTASVAAAAVLLQVYDGTQGVTWGQLNSTAHTIALIAGGSIAATAGISSGSTLSVTGSITSTLGISSGANGGSSGVLTLFGSTASSAVISAGPAGSMTLTAGTNVFTQNNLTVTSNTAVASTATQAILMSSTANFGIYYGNASPPTVSTAASGSLYISTGGTSTSTRLYVSNSVQSWVAVTTAS